MMGWGEEKKEAKLNRRVESPYVHSHRRNPFKRDNCNNRAMSAERKKKQKKKTKLFRFAKE